MAAQSNTSPVCQPAEDGIDHVGKEMLAALEGATSVEVQTAPKPEVSANADVAEGTAPTDGDLRVQQVQADETCGREGCCKTSLLLQAVQHETEHSFADLRALAHPSVLRLATTSADCVLAVGGQR